MTHILRQRVVEDGILQWTLDITFECGTQFIIGPTEDAEQCERFERFVTLMADEWHAAVHCATDYSEEPFQLLMAAMILNTMLGPRITHDEWMERHPIPAYPN